MSLHADLLDQAWRLATQEPRRPRQASLRRAVSAAYYALFHLLVDAATKPFAGGGSQFAGLRHLLARGYEHRTMVEASKSFGGGTLPAAIRQTIGPSVVPADLRFVAESFVLLQQSRHDADYNLALTWTRADTLVLVNRAAAAYTAWRRVRQDPMAILYLGLLSSHDSLRRR